MSPIEKACDLVGGVAMLAKMLGVKPPTVYQWIRFMNGDHVKGRQVPAERCPEIERVTGGKVRCEDLRPDVDWAVLRTSPEEAAA